MEIKIKKKDNITSVIFESSNREFKFADVDTSKEINTKERMTFLDMVKSLYMAGKKDDVLFIEQVGEDE